MTTLNDYMKDAQRLLREQRQDLLTPENLRVYINRARRDIVGRSQCVRIITPISGSITGTSLILSGSGYPGGGATVGITSPDFPSGAAPLPNGAQATATVTVSGGTISGIGITYGGSGYFQPTGSIVASSGAGASVTFQVAGINVLNQGQEVYPFPTIDTSANPGAGPVYMIKSISIIYSNYRYSLPVYSFSTYQAQIRQYPFQYQYVPTFASQFGQGTSGSFYVYPLPSQTYQYELDCFCMPLDLNTDTDVEIIPSPWTDAVPYMTCAYGMMALQNYNTAGFYKGWYDEMVQRYSNYARPGRTVNPYGRY
jgi:hypothetical protein